MTAVDLDALDKLRGALIEAMTSSARGNTYAQWTDTILPTVVQFANERAASELWEVADSVRNQHPGYVGRIDSADSIDARAADLRAATAEDAP